MDCNGIRVSLSYARTHTHTSSTVILLTFSFQKRKPKKCWPTYESFSTCIRWIGRNYCSWVMATALCKTTNTISVSAFKFHASYTLIKTTPWRAIQRKSSLDRATNKTTSMGSSMVTLETFTIVSHFHLRQFMVYNHETSGRTSQILRAQVAACAHKTGRKCS
jgi:hypothetical protein